MVSLALSMPRTPKGHKRPADVASNVVHVMRIATGEIEESEHQSESVNSAAAELGRLGGIARARNLSAKKRKLIASAAANTRWKAQKSGGKGRGRAK